MSPIISIIISTCNRAEHLRQTLDAMSVVQIPHDSMCELIVVDNASTDHTKQIVQETCMPQMTVRYLYESRHGKSFALNAAVALAQGNIIVFTDDDVRPASDWLVRLCAPISEGKADAVLGSASIAPCLLRPWMEALHKNCLASTENIDPEHPSEFVGINMAFSKAVLDRVPEFDTELGSGALGNAEDVLFSYQLKEAGYRLATAFDAKVEHHFDASRLERSHWIKRAVREARSRAYLSHHWHHQEIPRASWHLVHRTLRLQYNRLRRGKQCRSREGIPLWEFDCLYEVAYYAHFIKERHRQRNYEKHGLAKLTQASVS